jgi:hypothetical protein
MGFTVEEEIEFPQYGVSAANCYITIKATYTHSKSGAGFIGMHMSPNPIQQQGPYTLVSRFYVYAANDSSLSPLRESIITIPLEQPPADPIATIYAYIKSEHFAGKTITDDL